MPMLKEVHKLYYFQCKYKNNVFRILLISLQIFKPKNIKKSKLLKQKEQLFLLPEVKKKFMSIKNKLKINFILKSSHLK